MAKLARKTSILFGGSAGANQIAQFGSLAASAPAFSTDPAVIQGLSNWTVGWFDGVETGNSPAIEDMNAFCYVDSYQLAYLMQTGLAEWDSATTYFIGSLCTGVGTGIIYVSQQDNNLNNVVSSATYWLAYAPASAGSVAASALTGATLASNVHASSLTSVGTLTSLTVAGTISGSNVSGTNTGDITVASFGSSPTANGATLSGQALTLQPADATHPGGMTNGTQTIGGIKTFSTQLIGAGTILGDAAATGIIGQRVVSNISSGSAIVVATTNVFQNITTISLTAGDWDVSGMIEFANNGAVVTGIAGYISLFTGNTTTDYVNGDNALDAVPSSSTSNSSVSILNWQVNVTTTTTVFLKALGGFSAGNPKMFGRISARRMR